VSEVAQKSLDLDLFAYLDDFFNMEGTITFPRSYLRIMSKGPDDIGSDKKLIPWKLMDRKWMTSLDRKWSKNGFQFSIIPRKLFHAPSLVRFNSYRCFYMSRSMKRVTQSSTSQKTFFSYLAYLQSYRVSDRIFDFFAHIFVVCRRISMRIDAF